MTNLLGNFGGHGYPRRLNRRRGGRFDNGRCTETLVAVGENSDGTIRYDRKVLLDRCDEGTKVLLRREACKPGLNSKWRDCCTVGRLLWNNE